MAVMRQKMDPKEVTVSTNAPPSIRLTFSCSSASSSSYVTVSAAMSGALVTWRLRNALVAFTSAKTEALKDSFRAALADESVVTMVISTRAAATAPTEELASLASASESALLASCSRVNAA